MNYRPHSPEQNIVDEEQHHIDAIHMLCEAWYCSHKEGSITFNRAANEVAKIADTSAWQSFISQEEANRIAGEYLIACHKVGLKHATKNWSKYVGVSNGIPSAVFDLVNTGGSNFFGREYEVVSQKSLAAVYRYKSRVLGEYGCDISIATIKGWHKRFTTGHQVKRWSY